MFEKSCQKSLEAKNNFEVFYGHELLIQNLPLLQLIERKLKN